MDAGSDSLVLFYFRRLSLKRRQKKIYIFIIGDLTCLVDLINRPVYNGRHVIDKYWG